MEQMDIQQKRPELTDLSIEVLYTVSAFLDPTSLFALEATCGSFRRNLEANISSRCKCECFTTFLYPTIATYRMLAPVPKTWKELYVTFRTLRGMKWSVCQQEGTSSSLRSLKSDSQEYVVDVDTQFLIRSGGHYWFSVLQTRLENAALETEKEHLASTTPSGESNISQSSKDVSLEFLQSPRHITFSKWTKIRASGKSPCSRRHHSMTCLPKGLCQWGTLVGAGVNSLTEPETEELVQVKRVVFFGGQSEGIPFEAFNDLHVLFIQETTSASDAVKAHWLIPTVSGKPPSPRCGHCATLLSKDLILISGGSNGTSPISSLEVFLLHVESNTTFRWSTPACDTVPLGRSLHDVYKVSNDEVLIFGGRQIRQSNGLLDVLRLKIMNEDSDESSSDSSRKHYLAKWSRAELTGAIPSPRRGHSTNVIGTNLLLFGGQDDQGTGELANDVRVLDITNLHWRIPKIPGQAPCPRRGFKNQYFGTSLMISSGFVQSSTTGKIDHQLPDSDVHVLSIL